MNTPKLISPLSSSLAAVGSDRSKVAHPVQSLDFSRLLGQMRSESSVPARSSAQNHASTARDSAPQTRALDVAARDSSSRNQDAVAPSHDGHTQNTSSSNAANVGTPENTSENTPSQGARSNGSAEPSASQTAADGTEAATSQAGHSDSANQAAGEAPTNNAQLAEATADTGLAGAAALTTASATGPALSPQTGALPSTAIANVATHAAAVGASTPPQAGILAATDGTSAAADALNGEARLAALAALQSESQHPASHLAAAQAQLAQSALNGVHAQAAAAHTTNPATLAPLTGLNAMADVLAAQTSALPLAGEPATGAAALSLQLEEFNAMVAAARATSGTSLVPLNSIAENAGLAMASPSLAGLMPAGLMPGQGFAPASISTGISAPLSSPQWPTELGRQFISITQAAKGLGQVAELRLDPPELGPLRITINLNDNVAHAVFSSPHALVRQTVENALPQLQQMLEQAGISLGQANVNDQHQHEQASQEGTAQASAQGVQAGHGGVTQGEGPLSGTERRPVNPDALVDTFA